MNKSLKIILIIALILISTSLVLGEQINSVRTFGGETKSIYEYNLDTYCINAFVTVNANKDIEFTSFGTREYSLANCDFDSKINIRKDTWICNCTNGEFDLILTTLSNTINTYSFSLGFTYQENEPAQPSGNKNSTQQINTRSSGNGRCVTEWNCTEWTECTDNTQMRTCTYPENYCEPEDEMPELTQSCVIEIFESEGENFEFIEDTPIIEEDNNVSNPTNENQRRTGITGLATGSQTRNTLNLFAILLLIGFIAWFFYAVAKKKKKK